MKRFNLPFWGNAFTGRRRMALLFALPVLTLTAVALLSSLGCGSSSSSAQSDGPSSNIKLPSWVTAPGTPQDADVAYRFALDHPDLLSQVPCYCGCGQEAGHKSNLDCFIKSRNGDNVVFDQHGAG